MKQGWEIKKLGEICDFQGGSQPPKEEWIDEPREGYVRMLQIRDFTQSRSFDIEYVKESNRLKYCNEDDVLLGRYGASVGKVLTGLAGAYNVAIMKTMPNKDLLNKSYFKYFLESPSFQVFLQQACTMRAAQAGFSKEDVQDFTIPVPPREEQERIVEILDREFERIDALKANAEQNLQHAKDLFQAALKQELQPKEGWETKTISEISENLDYKRVPVTKKDRKEGVYPYYGASGIVDYVDGYLFDEDLLLVSEDGANLLARSTPIAFSVSGKIWVNNHAHILRFENIELQKFVEYFFANYDISKYVTGAAQPKFNQKALNNIVVSYPTDIVEQRKVVSCLDKLKEHCTALEENYRKTIALCDDMKQALLRKAFNGEL